VKEEGEVQGEEVVQEDAVEEETMIDLTTEVGIDLKWEIEINLITETILLAEINQEKLK